MLLVREDGSKRPFDVDASHPLPVVVSRWSSTGSFAAVAAGNYADNDVISNDADDGEGDPIEFAAAVRSTGGTAKVIGATLTMSEDGILATSELFLFSQAPTASEMDDNAAWGGVGAADLPYYLGSIAFGALADTGDISFATPSALTPAAPLFIRSETTTVYGVLVFRDAETNETAGMTVSITLYIE